MSYNESPSALFILGWIGLFAIWALVIGLLCYTVFVVVPENQAKQERQDTQAKEHCITPEFYNTNFETCERLGVRP